VGGNLFKLGRVPRARYLAIEAELRRYLDARFGERYRIPRYYGSKADFGDADIILSAAVMDEGWDALKQSLVGDLGITQFKYTGSVLSTVYRDFQVDFFIVPEDELVSTYDFMSFNDLGNLLGRTYRPFNLKYGLDGLSYVFRRADGAYKRELLVSRDTERILGFLQLDFEAWRRGFETLEEMFAWILACPYLRTEPYLAPDAPLRKRAGVRSTIRSFIAYLEAHGVERRYEHAEGRAETIARVDAFFPGANLAAAIAAEEEAERVDRRIADKLNGRVVMEVTGLAGEALGIFMRRFGERHPRASLAEMEPEAIRRAIADLAAEGPPD
jgi:hypothetical protein